MKFELDFLEEFIKKECRKTKKHSTAAIPDFQKKRMLLEQEVERIKKSFVTHLFEEVNESRFELFVQHHQAHIIRLADKVATVIDKGDSLNLDNITTSSTQLNLCKILLQSFEELLNHIEIHFSKYFDQDQKIPDTYAFISVKEFREKLDVLTVTFVEHELNKELFTIVLLPVVQFVSIPEKQNITFRRLIYLKYLINELMQLAKPEAKIDYSKSVFEHLFYLNFNSFSLVEYATSKIRKEIEVLPSITSQLEYLSRTLKELNQTQIKPSFALKPKRDSLKDILSKWLEEEIYFIERKRQLTLMMPPGVQRFENLNDFKVKTILSVPQIAYLIRILKDTGIITNDNKTDLIRFFSKYFSSIHNENISQESLRSKFFAYERSAVTHIQGVLAKLMDHSRKNE